MDISALSFPLYFTPSGISPSLSSRAPNEILLKSKYRRHPFLVPPTSTLQTQAPFDLPASSSVPAAVTASHHHLPTAAPARYTLHPQQRRAGTHLPQSDGSKAKPRYYGIPSAASSTPTASPQPNHNNCRNARLKNQTLRERKGRKKMPSTTSPPPSNTSSPSSPNTLTPETLETDLLTHLASTTALEDLHATLLSSLQRLGWTEKIRKLSLELLRAGRCERFDDVVEAVVASAAGIKPPSAAAQNGNGNSNNNHSEDDLAELDEMDVRIPKAVVEQGVRAIKEVLREVIVIEDDPDLNALHQSEHVSESKGSLEAEGEKEKSKISKSGESSVKNGDTSPTKKTEKKPKTGKQVK
ncbi:LOW QUALITY PROTEIN: hypothetical protein IFM46972_03714 [Aspergillus udagawae]|uniref:Uncharacterized protein n=1 Tax=Aspergillus udagawae TaxID=91492 RepID=A0A8H3RMU2_9EURO|nr:LOW QUALITY PROTEIN: hypothetical protein IFM46972_03714 [Aspergillus udagawae]